MWEYVAYSCCKQNKDIIEMNDAHAYEIQMQIWKPNTWDVIALPPYKNLVPRFGKCTIVDRIPYNLLVNNLLSPK
jgi:hypothetical protein